MGNTQVRKDQILFNRYKAINDIECKGSHEYRITRIWKCLDTWSGQIVTLKSLTCLLAYDHAQSIQQCKGLMVASELQRQSDNFLKINDIFYRSSSELGRSFVVVSEYMDLTLAEAMKTKTFSFDDKIRILYKLIKALSEMEDAGIVHTNLNPNHILLSEDLQKVKITGFVNNAQDSMSWYRDRLFSRYIRGDDITFRPIELMLYALPDSDMPLPNSSMDVWSLGCVFAYMLKDGISIFGRNDECWENCANAYYGVFVALGYPAYSEALGLGVRYPVQGSEGQLTEKLAKIMPKDKNTVNWLPLLESMLNYHPQKRIKIKELLHHTMFKKYFEPIIFRLPKEGSPKTAKMERIWIQFPREFDKYLHNDIKKYYKVLLDMRKKVAADEKRRDLVILAHNLCKITSVPSAIWINIFMLANTDLGMDISPKKSNIVT